MSKSIHLDPAESVLPQSVSEHTELRDDDADDVADAALLPVTVEDGLRLAVLLALPEGQHSGSYTNRCHDAAIGLG